MKEDRLKQAFASLASLLAFHNDLDGFWVSKDLQVVLGRTLLLHLSQMSLKKALPIPMATTLLYALLFRSLIEVKT